MQRVDDHSLLERLDRRRAVPALGQTGGELEQQSQVRLAHRVAPGGQPTLRSDPREQLAAVKLERRPIVRRLAGLAGAGDRRLEGVDVDLHSPARIQRQHVVAQREHGRSVGAGRLQRPPGDVQRLMEVVGRRLGRPLGPQQLGRPLAVDSTLRRQREQLHQALGLTQPPRALGYHLLADANGEGAEQPNLHGSIHPPPGNDQLFGGAGPPLRVSLPPLPSSSDAAASEAFPLLSNVDRRRRGAGVPRASGSARASADALSRRGHRHGREGCCPIDTLTAAPGATWVPPLEIWKTTAPMWLQVSSTSGTATSDSGGAAAKHRGVGMPPWIWNAYRAAASGRNLAPPPSGSTPGASQSERNAGDGRELPADPQFPR